MEVVSGSLMICDGGFTGRFMVCFARAIVLQGLFKFRGCKAQPNFGSL